MAESVASRRKRAAQAAAKRDRKAATEKKAAAERRRSAEVTSGYPKGHRRRAQTEINAARRDRAALSPRRGPAPASAPRRTGATPRNQTRHPTARQRADEGAFIESLGGNGTKPTSRSTSGTAATNGTRGEAFKKARAAGKKAFTWKGKKYHTRTAEEDARKKVTKKKAIKKKAVAKKETPTQRYRRQRRRAPGRVR